MDLEPGTVLLYGPGAEHTATSQGGLEYAFGSFRLQALEETADRLHLKLIPPAKGLVRALAPTPKVRSLTAILGLGDDQGTSIESALDGPIDTLHVRWLHCRPSLPSVWSEKERGSTAATSSTCASSMSRRSSAFQPYPKCAS